MKNDNSTVRGASGSMPNRGTKTGVKNTYGADLSSNATNRRGNVKTGKGGGKGKGAC